jgi:hypothetical protein
MRVAGGRGVLVAACLSCLLLVSGCTPLSAGFVAVDGGKYVLQIPEECDLKIVGVVVFYAGDDYSGTSLWEAKADFEDASNRVVLFEPNVGYAATGDASAIDFSRELGVGWGEGESDMPGGVNGVLADLEPGEVLWIDGIVSADSYKAAVSSPFTNLRCPRR